MNTYFYQDAYERHHPLQNHFITAIIPMKGN